MTRIIQIAGGKKIPRALNCICKSFDYNLVNKCLEWCADFTMDARATSCISAKNEIKLKKTNLCFLPDCLFAFKHSICAGLRKKQDVRGGAGEIDGLSVETSHHHLHPHDGSRTSITPVLGIPHLLPTLEGTREAW